MIQITNNSFLYGKGFFLKNEDVYKLINANEDFYIFYDERNFSFRFVISNKKKSFSIKIRKTIIIKKNIYREIDNHFHSNSLYKDELKQIYELMGKNDLLYYNKFTNCFVIQSLIEVKKPKLIILKSD